MSAMNACLPTQLKGKITLRRKQHRKYLLLTLGSVRLSSYRMATYFTVITWINIWAFLLTKVSWCDNWVNYVLYATTAAIASTANGTKWTLMGPEVMSQGPPAGTTDVLEIRPFAGDRERPWNLRVWGPLNSLASHSCELYNQLIDGQRTVTWLFFATKLQAVSCVDGSNGA